MRWFARLFKILIAIVVLGIIGVFTVLVPVFDGRSNQIRHVPLPPVDSASAALHATLAVADLHADPLLWPRSIVDRIRRGHVDLPRLREGRVALQVFSAVTQTPRAINYVRNDSTTDMIRWLAIASRWPRSTWGSRVERALFMAGRFDRAVSTSGSRLVPVRSTADVARLLARRASNPSLVGGLLAIEGAHATEGRIANLERLYDAGYRMVGLTHFFDNEVGGSSAGVDQGGLTPFGKEVLVWMAERRMIVDLAHASRRLIEEVLETSRRPVVVSHTGVQATCPGPRNLSDDLVSRIAGAGGLLGIGFWEGAVCALTPDTIAAAVAHTATLVGVDHVALGSDFDGATTVAFDASQLVLVTDALSRRGFAAQEIRQIMGGNVIRFLMEHLPPG